MEQKVIFKNFNSKYQLFELLEDGTEKLVVEAPKPEGIVMLIALQKDKKFRLKVEYETQYSGSGGEILKSIMESGK